MSRRTVNAAVARKITDYLRASDRFAKTMRRECHRFNDWVTRLEGL